MTLVVCNMDKGAFAHVISMYSSSPFGEQEFSFKLIASKVEDVQFGLVNTFDVALLPGYQIQIVGYFI